MALANHAKWLRSLRSAWPQLGWALVAMLVLAGLQLPAPLLTMRVLDSVAIARPNVSQVPLLIGFLIGLFCLRLAVTAGQRFALEKFRISVVFLVQQVLLGALIRLPLSYHLKSGHGGLLSRLEEDPDQIDSFLSDTVLTSISDLVTLLLGVSLLFYINWRLAALAVISIPISGILVFRLRKSMKHNVGELQDRIADLSGFLAEVLGNIVSVKTLALESWVGRRYSERAKKITAQKMRIMRARVLYESLVACCSGLTPILILWYAGYGIARHTVSVGEFVAFSGYLAYLYRPADSLIISVLNAQSAISAAERVSSLLDQPGEEVAAAVRSFDLDRGRPPSVRFRSVYFRYDQSQDWILRDVSCDFTAGSMIAIMGPSGSGKTTLVNLIPQLIQPNVGLVSINGLDYGSLTELRKQISLVSCDTLMFSGSVRENIAMGNESASPLDVEHAAQMACIERWWLDDRQGDGDGAEGGRSLSAGQRQRVLIARAILRKPSILILDEATSALDVEMERRVICNLRSLSIPLVIIVSHRHSIREHADQTYYLSSGVLSHAEAHEKRTLELTAPPVVN